MSKEYYLYTNGFLKRVEREEPIHGINTIDFEDWARYIANLPSIQVSDDLKSKWKEGDRPVEGKDFELKIQYLYTKDEKGNDVWKTFDQPFYKEMCPERQMAKSISVDPIEDKQEESQNSLWTEVSLRVLNADTKSIAWIEVVRELESSYTITRKAK